MSNEVQFDTDSQNMQAYRNVMNQRRPSGIASLLIKFGIIKDESQAPIAQILIIVINLAITAFVIYKFFL